MHRPGFGSARAIRRTIAAIGVVAAMTAHPSRAGDANLRIQVRAASASTAAPILVAAGVGAIAAAVALLLSKRRARRALEAARARTLVETELRRIVAQQRALLDAADCCIISTDPGGLITNINRATERRLGYRSE